jgi:osmotically-inducible protein OsmY
MRLLKISLALVLLTAGCKLRDRDILAEVCRKTGEKAETVLGTTPAHLTGNLPMGDASMAARVHNRIHWDRYLHNLKVQVHTPAAGMVRLHGQVPDLALKQRILDLAKSTVGVEHVEDRLKLPEDN